MPTLYPAAAWRPLGPQTQSKMAAHDIICLHTMVGSLSGTDNYFKAQGYGGTESHFGVGGSGTVYQWQDLEYIADANYRGSRRIISIETADIGPEFPKWNTNDGSAVPAWTPRQIQELAKIIAWCAKRYSIPLSLIPDSKPNRRGIGYHRQGVLGYMVAGGEQWSTARGKVCPGNRRIAQIPQIIELAKGSGGTPIVIKWPSGRRILQLTNPMMHGEDVLRIQKWANPRFSYARLAEDGWYGNDTYVFVRQFQGRTKLAIDGVVGPQTYLKMEEHGFR